MTVPGGVRAGERGRVRVAGERGPPRLTAVSGAGVQIGWGGGNSEAYCIHTIRYTLYDVLLFVWGAGCRSHCTLSVQWRGHSAGGCFFAYSWRGAVAVDIFSTGSCRQEYGASVWLSLVCCTVWRVSV